MNEINNYKYLFFKKIYEELGLSQVEKELPNKKIMPLNVAEDQNYKIISHYFFLLNEINLDALNQDQLTKFHQYFSKNINSLSAIELEEIGKFIEETYPILLFPNIEENYVYYGAVSDNYICPKDAIALGLYYDALIDADDFEIENNLAPIINHIQFDLAEKINKKIEVITFNQLTLDNLPNSFKNK